MENYLLVLLLAICALTVNPAVVKRNAEREGMGSSSSASSSSSSSNEVEPTDNDDSGFSFSFSMPTFNFPNIMNDFEEAVNKVLSTVVNGTSSIPEANSNDTTVEQVTIGGQLYNITKTVINRASNNSRVLISATSMIPAKKK